MNNETKKTTGQIAMEAYCESPELGNLMPLRFQKAADAVLSHALQGAKWVLVPASEALPTDEIFDNMKRIWFPVGSTKYRDEWPVRRLISGLPGGPSTTPPASSGAAVADVPAAWVPKFKVGDEVQIRNPHHSWEHGIRKIGKVLIERHRYVLADDSHETSWPEEALKPFSWPGIEKQSAEPVVEEKTPPCPWCIPGVDNCHHTQAEIRQFEFARDSVRAGSFPVPSDWVPRSQFNALLESRDGAIKHFETLEVERDQLRKELEHERSNFGHDNMTAALHALEAAGMGRKGKANTLRAMAEEATEELTRLRSQFRWIPVSERLPTEEDANEASDVLWRRHDASTVSDRWDFEGPMLEAFGYICWLGIPKYTTSPPETEEERNRREYNEWVDGDSSPNMDRGEKEIGWLAWKAARSTP